MLWNSRFMEHHSSKTYLLIWCFDDGGEEHSPTVCILCAKLTLWPNDDTGGNVTDHTFGFIHLGLGTSTEHSLTFQRLLFQIPRHGPKVR